MDVVNCVSPTFAMSGALAWQVKKSIIKKRIFLGFEGGDGTGLFIYLFCPALPLLCWTGSLFPYLSTHFLVSAGRIPKTLHIVPGNQCTSRNQHSNNINHHPKVYSAIDKLIS